MNARSMSKVKKKAASRTEYRRAELGAGVRGKHLAAFRAGTSIVLLEPDVAAAFPTARAVNKALRTLMDTPVRPASRRTKTG